MTKYYALRDTGDIVYLGEFENFHEADASLKFNAVWIIDKEGAHQWMTQLAELLA